MFLEESCEDERVDRMRDKVGLAIIFISVIMTVAPVFCQSEETAQPAEWPQINLDTQDRILILAPHPDDEILACAGIIQKAKALGVPLRIVFLTYGDNNEWAFFVYRKHPVIIPKAVRGMGLIRHDEALLADKAVGVLPKDINFLGYPDFGTLDIWYRHWQDSPSFLSMLTKVRAVPYPNAFRPGALYKGEEIAKDIAAILKEFKPTKIFLSHPADHNVDHRSLYLFTRVAIWELKIQKGPQLYPYLVHYKEWPLPRGRHPEKKIEPPQAYQEQIPWEVDLLSAEEVNRKEEALKKHHSQYESAAAYLDSFVRSNELFGDFPSVALAENVPPVNLSADIREGPGNNNEELTEEERGAFVGFEERYVSLEKDYLTITIRISRPLGKEVGVSVYLFGYRPDVSFAQMPKLHLRLGILHTVIYDQNRKVSGSGIKIARKPKEVTIRVPLKVLGNPKRVLTSATTYLGNVSLDWVSWRILELP
jgi:LmbE family N-acetylglucosaminyl deacetylase